MSEVAAIRRAQAAEPLFAWGVARYPACPGFKARATSRAAAKAMSGRSRALQQRVLELLSVTPLTADECAWRLRESVLSVRPRCTELAHPAIDGSRGPLIADSGLRRRNASGRPAIVWAKI